MLKAIPTPNGAKPSEMGPMRANSRPSGPLSKLEPSSPSAETVRLMRRARPRIAG